MYAPKESRIGLNRICRPPTYAVLRERITNATSKMIALVDGAIRQIRHDGLPDEAGSDWIAVCACSGRRPQK
jgi:hypothetical protein